MSQKILLITGDGGESYETLYAVHRFREAGYEPHIAAPTKKRLNLVMHDFEPGWDTFMEQPGYKLESDLVFPEVRVEEYVATLLLGGRAPEYLRHNPTVIDIVKKFYAQERWIFSICHGIQLVIAAGLAKGKNLTCYDQIRFDVEAAGGTYCTPEAVRDGRIVSAQTWLSHPEFFREIFNCLGER
jgi:protease I